MTTSITRRVFLAATATCAAGAAAPRDPQARFAAIETQVRGRLGVAALDAQSGASILYRADERFTLCSTFKAPLAAAVLARVQSGAVSLDQLLPYTAADLLDYAPVTRAHIAEGALSVEALCAAAVEVSDNTAANLLLPLIGGPAGFTAFMRGLGDAVTRLDRIEPALNADSPGDVRDTTTPAAIGRTMATILTTDRALADGSRARLIEWLERAQTGRDRLRAGLPPSWRAGDKTGTGAAGAANDVAIAWPPARAPLVIACYLRAPDATAGARNGAHAEVARIVAEALG